MEKIRIRSMGEIRMIYTLTTNPAIDYHMDLEETGFQPGQINRSAREEMFPGGKGLNVSVVLSQLGIPSRAFGFVAGKAGTLLETLARENGCDCNFIPLPQGETRINVKLDCAQETAVNGNGPQIPEEQVQALLRKVEALCPGDTLVLSGKLQAGSFNLYESVCRICREKGIRFVVDTEGEDLKRTLPYRPFLIKPNEEELLGLFGCTNSSQETLIRLMHSCRESGAENVLVTLGKAGALFLSSSGVLYQAAVHGDHSAVSTVGAGDSTIAGFLAGMDRYGEDYSRILRLACAAGTATACRKWLCRREEIEAVWGNISVTEIRS